MMSVSDPLIKELKGLTRNFTENGTDIIDSTGSLLDLCKCLEKCFQKGVIVHTNSFTAQGFPEAWHWMQDITKRNEDCLLSYANIIETVLENQKVQDTTGRFRLLIRTCLNRKCLHVPVGYLVRTPFLASNYYCADSIIGDEILGEILYSVLLQISKLNFKLNLRNASFLDDTWDLPESISINFVPSKTLGISVCFTRGKSLIIKIEKNSVAGDEERIEIGDVLDEINGNAILSQTRGNLRKIMKKNTCLPISVHIIKYRNTITGELFSPIANIIKSSSFDHLKMLHRFSKLELLHSDDEFLKRAYDHRRKFPLEVKPWYLVQYCGSIAIGSKGDVKQLDKAMRQLLHQGNTNYVLVRFECLELGIKITRDSDEKEILTQSYIEISSCGRSNNFPNHFAFISGETTCSIASSFTAHLFYHKIELEIQTILQSIGHGFHRTNFAV